MEVLDERDAFVGDPIRALLVGSGDGGDAIATRIEATFGGSTIVREATASGGWDRLDARAEAFDCVVVAGDELPDADPTSLLAELELEYPSLPRVFVPDGDAPIEEALAAGATDVFADPADASDALVERRLENAIAAGAAGRSREDVVAELGETALAGTTDELLDAVVDRVATAVDAEYCSVFEARSAGRLECRAAAGWEEAPPDTLDADADTHGADAETASLARYVLRRDEPVIVADLETNERFDGAERLRANGVRSSVAVTVGTSEEPWGVLGVHSRTPRHFDAADARFVRNVAALLASSVERDRDATTTADARALADRIVETSPIGITVANADGEMTFANDRAEEILGRSREEINALCHDADEWAAIGPDGDPLPSEEFPFDQAVRAEEPIYDRVLSVRRPDGDRRWLSVNAALLRDGDRVDGAVFAIEDVTERRRLETELEEVLGRVTDAFFGLDDDWTFTYVNERAEELLDRPAEELRGRNVWEAFTGAVGTTFEERYREAMATQEPVEFEEYYPPLDTWFAVRAYPSETGLSVYFRDVTERVALERERRETSRTLRELYSISADADASFDEKLERALRLGRDYLGVDVGFLANVDRDGGRFEIVDVRGESETLDAETECPLEETYCRRTIDSDGLLTVSNAPTEGWEGDDAYRIHDFDTYIGGKVLVNDELFGTLCFCDESAREAEFTATERTVVELLTQWISYELERIERERDLERYREYTDDLLDAIDDVFYVLDREGNLQRWNESAPAVTGYSDEEIASMNALEFFPESEREAIAAAIAEGFETGHARVEAELRTGDGERIPYEIVGSALESPAGEPVLTGIARDVSQRRERERTLERQREELARLNRLNRAVQDVTHALVEASTREEIERRVCDRLVDVEEYAFAWFGRVDRNGTTVTPRAWAGVEEGYLEDVTITIDDSETGQGPTGTAFRTGETQVMQDVLNDPEYEPWRDQARDRGFRSSAAIPVTHEGTTYGVLNVYADDESAFGARERALLDQLGAVVGHAVSAIERKRALVSDANTELEVDLGAPPEALADLATDGATLRIDRALPTTGNAYVYFLTATGIAYESLHDAFTAWEAIDDIRLLEEGDDEVLFELEATDPPIGTAVVEHDGRIREATIVEGSFRVALELPYERDVRSVLEDLQEAYPDARILAQRTVDRDERSAVEHRMALDDRLTDRQRTVLETAYYSGFFDWPRTSTGEEVAERLDISPATFTQHLRIAERKLLAVLLAERGVEGA